MINTRNPNELLDHLRSVNVYGGGDCPEMSLSGIKLALENALPNSFVYVFTDADAKDEYLFYEVLNLLQQKRTSVRFNCYGFMIEIETCKCLRQKRQ